MKKISIFFLTVSLLLMQATFASVLPNAAHVYVEGQAEIEVDPDRLVFLLSIEETDLDASKAKANVERRLSKLINTIAELKLNTEALSAEPYQISPSYQWHNGQQDYKGTQVSVHVTLTLEQVNRYAEVMNALVSAEITGIIRSHAELSDSRSHYKRAQALAIADARQKAADLAKLNQAELGKIYSISEFNMRQSDHYLLQVNQQAPSVNQAKMVMAEMRGDASGANLALGKMQVSASVYLVFLLD